METSKLIKRRRLELGLTLKEVSKALGISESTVSRYETNDIYNMGIDKIIPLAKILKVSPTYLMGWEDDGEDVTPDSTIQIKVYQTIPAGLPLEAIADMDDTEGIPIEWLEKGDTYIGLKVGDDSMYPKYFEGDTAIVRLQAHCENGWDAVVFVNDHAATIKQYFKDDDTITLKPFNTQYPPKKYREDEIKILGVVRQSRRTIWREKFE